jgi:hypothetical protein
MDRGTQLSCSVAINDLAAIAVFAIIGRAAIAILIVVGLAATDVLTVVGIAAIALFAIANGNSIVDSQNVHDTSAQTKANVNVALPHEPAVTRNERALVLHKSANRKQGVRSKALALPYYGIGDAQQAMVANAVTALLAHGIAYIFLANSNLVFPLELAIPEGVLALPWYMRDTSTVFKVSDLLLVYLLTFAHTFQDDAHIAQPQKALHDRFLTDGRTDTGLQQEPGVAEDAHGDELALLQVSIVDMSERFEVSVSMPAYTPSLTHNFQADVYLAWLQERAELVTFDQQLAEVSDPVPPHLTTLAYRHQECVQCTGRPTPPPTPKQISLKIRIPTVEEVDRSGFEGVTIPDPVRPTRFYTEESGWSSNSCAPNNIKDYVRDAVARIALAKSKVEPSSPSRLGIDNYPNAPDYFSHHAYERVVSYVMANSAFSTYCAIRKWTNHDQRRDLH